MIGIGSKRQKGSQQCRTWRRDKVKGEEMDTKGPYGNQALNNKHKYVIQG